MKLFVAIIIDELRDHQIQIRSRPTHETQKPPFVKSLQTANSGFFGTQLLCRRKPSGNVTYLLYYPLSFNLALKPPMRAHRIIIWFQIFYVGWTIVLPHQTYDSFSDLTIRSLESRDIQKPNYAVAIWTPVFETNDDARRIICPITNRQCGIGNLKFIDKKFGGLRNVFYHWPYIIFGEKINIIVVFFRWGGWFIKLLTTKPRLILFCLVQQIFERAFLLVGHQKIYVVFDIFSDRFASCV